MLPSNLKTLTISVLNLKKNGQKLSQRRVFMTEKKETQSASNKDWKNYELLEETKKLRTAKSTLYVPKKDRYEDSKSTAIIFCIFGVLGDVVAILSALDILHLPIANNIVSQVAMIALFTFFLWIGISSGIKAQKLKSELGEEEDDTNTINTWLEEHITKEMLDEICDQSQGEEINYLHKLEYVKEQLTTEFPEADDEYLDLLTDQFVSKQYES